MKLEYFVSLANEISIRDRRLKQFIPNLNLFREFSLPASSIRSVLYSFIPKNLEIGHGFILAEDGSTYYSEILIYKKNTFLPYKESDFVILPAKSVSASLVVKPDFDNLEEDLHKWLSLSSEIQAFSGFISLSFEKFGLEDLLLELNGHESLPASSYLALNPDLFVQVNETKKTIAWEATKLPENEEAMDLALSQLLYQLYTSLSEQIITGAEPANYVAFSSEVADKVDEGEAMEEANPYESEMVDEERDIEEMPIEEKIEEDPPGLFADTEADIDTKENPKPLLEDSDSPVILVGENGLEEETEQALLADDGELNGEHMLPLASVQLDETPNLQEEATEEPTSEIEHVESLSDVNVAEIEEPEASEVAEELKADHDFFDSSPSEHVEEEPYTDTEPEIETDTVTSSGFLAEETDEEAIIGEDNIQKEVEFTSSLESKVETPVEDEEEEEEMLADTSIDTDDLPDTSSEEMNTLLTEEVREESPRLDTSMEETAPVTEDRVAEDLTDEIPGVEDSVEDTVMDTSSSFLQEDTQEKFDQEASEEEAISENIELEEAGAQEQEEAPLKLAEEAVEIEAFKEEEEPITSISGLEGEEQDAPTLSELENESQEATYEEQAGEEIGEKIEEDTAEIKGAYESIATEEKEDILEQESLEQVEEELVAQDEKVSEEIGNETEAETIEAVSVSEVDADLPESLNEPEALTDDEVKETEDIEADVPVQEVEEKLAMEASEEVTEISEATETEEAQEPVYSNLSEEVESEELETVEEPANVSEGFIENKEEEIVEDEAETVAAVGADETSLEEQNIVSDTPVSDTENIIEAKEDLSGTIESEEVNTEEVNTGEVETEEVETEEVVVAPLLDKTFKESDTGAAEKEDAVQASEDLDEAKDKIVAKEEKPEPQSSVEAEVQALSMEAPPIPRKSGFDKKFVPKNRRSVLGRKNSPTENRSPKDGANSSKSRLGKPTPPITPKEKPQIDLKSADSKRAKKVHTYLQENEQGNHPVHLAVINNDLKALKLILRDENQTELKNKKGYTPLHFAAELNLIELALVLLENGADVNSRTYVYDAPIHLAVLFDNHEMVRVLIEHSAEVEVRNNRGNTPMHRAARYRSVNSAKLLIENYADIHARMERDLQPLHLAAWYGNIEMLQLLVDEGVELDAVNSDGNTALHFAAFNGQVKVIKTLINHKANTGIRNVEGETYLQGINEGYQGQMTAILN